ncbi:DUF421 domain-containing protein [Bacillus sp. ISL-18]|uniref:DUF421 domain-containing protein n=1 Tax=Bacillus sp. ISL-18 TaxID=2819118 RepID=UPI001BE866DB|nr:YetF domain-containing protein [Bacillus sp. ISL-18]MBT2658079.1 DUF421 domain-containing protein [Bacillus sp. ISL-18]
MDLSFIVKSFILFFTGVFLLRIAGRKSISQMTLAQTIVIVSLGHMIVEPIVEVSMVKAIGGAVIFVVSIIVVEYIQLHFNRFEKLIMGKSKMVIENGELNIKNLKKLRLTVDGLEMRMRNMGLTKIADIKMATIEPNGQLGYELKEEAKPLTIGEFKKLMNISSQQNESQDAGQNIFDEIYSDTPQKHPEYLN